MPNTPDDKVVLLFDGVCNLCNGFVNFILDRDPSGKFYFGALQSEAAQPYLQGADVSPDQMDSMVLIENNRVHLRSDAFLHSMRLLPIPWSLLYAFAVVPRTIRDFVYRRVATNRYNWFGRRDGCRVPTPEVKQRFLSASEVGK